MLIKYLILIPLVSLFTAPGFAGETVEPEVIIEEPQIVEEVIIPQAPVDKSACDKYVPLLEQYDWDVEIAKEIMWHESNCYPYAENSTDVHKNWKTGEVICVGSHGLFQIACPSGVVYDVEKNIEVAYHEKYSTPRGWRHWSVCTNGTMDCGI